MRASGSGPMRGRYGAARGQVLVPGAIMLLGVVLLIFSSVAAATQWGDVEAVESATRLAAIAGAHAYDPTSMAGGVAGLDASGEAERAARHIFAENLRRSFGGRFPRVDTSDAALAAALRVVVFNPTPRQPTYTDTNPTPCGQAGRRVFTYATVFVSADLSIGLVDARGAAIPHHFHACAQAI